jgi:hypothetical protein
MAHEKYNTVMVDHEDALGAVDEALEVLSQL